VGWLVPARLISHVHLLDSSSKSLPVHAADQHDRASLANGCGGGGALGQDTIRVQARDFGKDPAEAIKQEIHRRYANKASTLISPAQPISTRSQDLTGARSGGCRLSPRSDCASRCSTLLSAQRAQSCTVTAASTTNVSNTGFVTGLGHELRKSGSALTVAASLGCVCVADLRRPVQAHHPATLHWRSLRRKGEEPE